MTALRSRLGSPNILIALLVALAVIFFNWLVWRAQWPLEIDVNESWNAYQATDWPPGCRFILRLTR